MYPIIEEHVKCTAVKMTQGLQERSAAPVGLVQTFSYLWILTDLIASAPKYLSYDRLHHLLERKLSCKILVRLTYSC